MFAGVTVSGGKGGQQNKAVKKRAREHRRKGEREEGKEREKTHAALGE